MIEIRNVSCRLNGQSILDNISCSIEEGKLSAIIGPNGSGKSTLLKCIMKFINYSGEILIDKKPAPKGFDLARQVSWFAQSQNITFPHTVFDVVLMGRRPYAPYRYTENDYELTGQCVEQMGLASLKDRPIDRLSGGELQKVFLARSLVQDTKYMLLDEPLNNIDPNYQISIIKKLIELKNKKGIAVVLHDISLLRFFDTIIMIKNGNSIKNNYNCKTLEDLYDIHVDKFSNGTEAIYLSSLEQS